MRQPDPNATPFSSARSREVLVARCQSLLTSLPPGCVFSHLTAAALHGLPMSDAMEADQRIHVIRPIDRTQNRGLGVVGHRARHPREMVEVDGMPVTGLADTWVDIGELIGPGKPVGLDDTIVLGDAIATRLKDVAPLISTLGSRVRPRGKCTLLEALELIRVGSVSARETLVRIMFVRVGLPEADLWLTEEIWDVDLTGIVNRQDMVRRFAKAIEYPIELLDLNGVEPRFYSPDGMDLAQRRNDRRRRRAAA